jgi:hypothetical protein
MAGTNPDMTVQNGDLRRLVLISAFKQSHANLPGMMKIDTAPAALIKSDPDDPRLTERFAETDQAGGENDD